MQFIEPAERCHYCFSSDIIAENSVCDECRRKRCVLSGISAAFDYSGPARTLMAKMKYGNLSYLATGAGAFMAAQFTRMNWPWPDYIVPVPISTMHYLERGYNQSLLLADSISTILSTPVLDALTRSGGDYSQAGLNKEQRMNLPGSTLRIKEGVDLARKRILLVDDVMTTGSTLRRCAEALQWGWPSSIHSITLCKTI